MNWIQNLIVKLLKIRPSHDKDITLKEPYTFQQNILKNRIWYNGEPAELEQFFKSIAYWDCEKTRFWAAQPNGLIRKIHSGIVSMVIDRYKDIVTSDLDEISLGEGTEETPLKDLWDKIAKDNDFVGLLSESIQNTLALGDGAFKIFTDEVSQYPVIQFYEMDNVAYKYRYGRLREIKFYTDYQKDGKDFRLEEIYGRGYIKYKLYDSKGRECDINMLLETQGLEDLVFEGDFILGVPFMVFNSTKYKGRGKALFDSKSDVLDALDEVISQWLDAIRLGRIKRYIPDDLIPRDEITGAPLPPNPFDNDFMAIGSSMAENAKEQKIDVSQPQIAYDAYVSSYCNYLDMVLQGIMSPSTLGIDLKKTDNADSQREKEKITLHVRGKIVDALNEVIPEVVGKALMFYDLMNERAAGEYEASVKFGEYASPDFDSTVETIGKAKSYGVMSIYTAIEQMYGDTWTDDEKKEEVERIKEEQGVSLVNDTGVNDDLNIIDDDE